MIYQIMMGLGACGLVALYLHLTHTPPPRIINRGVDPDLPVAESPREAVCLNCESLLEYTNSIIHEYETNGSIMDGKPYITCPVCHQRVTAKRS